MENQIVSPPLKAKSSNRENLLNALRVVQDGLAKMIETLKKHQNPHFRAFLQEMESCLSFFETLNLIKDSMPDQRFQDALRNTARSIHSKFENLSKTDLSLLPDIEMDTAANSLLFISLAYRFIGPWISVSPNEMKAWIRIDKSENQFFTPEKIITCLNQIGVIKGINEESIQELFQKKLFDQQILAAEGILPQNGKNGRVEYTFDINSLNRKPKELANGKVTLDDINLCIYIAEGDAIARLIPPVLGIPGYTVTNRTITPPIPKLADLPVIENTHITEDQENLVASMDGCILQKNGHIVLEPNLRIKGNISYETGNIDSKVLVWIGKDVMPGFSVSTDKDIFIGGVVEGASLKSKGNIMIKGGILGKEKSVIECNGTIHAKYVANAKISSMEDIIVEKEITHSQLWAGGTIILIHPLGKIIGGDINADGEVIASQIGSELGVKTSVTLGIQSEKISKLIEENQIKIEEQEEMQEKCLQIIDMLDARSQQTPENKIEIENALKKAHIMLAEADNNVKTLNKESDLLQIQYEESAKRIRTIRARTTILPGTILSIQSIECIITKSTGPCTVVCEGDHLAFYPFQELNEGIERTNELS